MKNKRIDEKGQKICKILLMLVKFCQILLILVKFCKNLLILVKFCKILLILVNFCKILLILVKFCKNLLMLVKFCKIPAKFSSHNKFAGISTELWRNLRPMVMKERKTAILQNTVKLNSKLKKKTQIGRASCRERE